MLRYLGFIVFSMGLFACSPADEDKAKGSKVDPVPRAPTPAPSNEMTPARKLRRLSLQLRGTLPSNEELTVAEESLKNTDKLLDIWLSDPRSAIHFAKTYLPNLRPIADESPVLEEYSQPGGALSGILDDELRNKIVSEPLQMLRWVFETDLSFTNLLGGQWGIVHTDLLPIWGLSSFLTPWPGEPWELVDYGSRPSLGIFGTHGYRAQEEARYTDPHYPTMVRILDSLRCQTVSGPKAHLFSSISDGATLGGSLREAAKNDKECSSCHGRHEGMARYTSGSHAGMTLIDWLSYTDPGLSDTEYASGLPLEGPDAVASYFAADPSVTNCLLQNVLSSTLQRSFSPQIDHRFTKIAVTMMGLNNRSLKSAIKVALLYGDNLTDVLRPDPESKVDEESESANPEDSPGDADATPMDSDTNNTPKSAQIDGANPKAGQGLRVLRYTHWEALARTLTPSSTTIVVPVAIDSQQSRLNGRDRFTVESPWFHHVRNLALKFAEAIVADELGSSATPAARKWLSQLPSGSGAGVSNDVKISQIKSLYFGLTGEEIDELTLESMQVLQSAGLAAGASSDDQSRRSWRLVIAGIMSSYRFVTF